MILRSTDVRGALRSRQGGFLLNPYRFGNTPIVGWNANVSALAPVIWWRLDESSGTAFADSSGNSRSGNLVGSPNRAVPVGFAGVGNGVENTSQSGQFASRASESAMQITGDVTVIIAVKPNGAQAMFAKLAWKPTVKLTGSSTYQLLRNGSLGGAMTLLITAGGANFGASGTTVISSGVSYLIVGRRQGSEMSIWVNGVNEGIATLTQPADTSALDLEVGGSTSNDCLVGVYSNFALFNYALSDSQIATLYANRNIA